MEIGTKEYILLKVLVQKSKSNYISLEGECYNQSNAVYENGSSRETYEPFTNDDPQNGVAEALAEQMKMNEAALLAAADGTNAVVNSTGDSKTEGDLPQYNKEKNYNEGDRVKVNLNGKDFPATIKPKKDGSLYAAVDDYGEFIKAGEESYEKAKPTEQLVGAAVTDVHAELVIEQLKWLPMGARWFGEKTGLGDENSYKENTECIERITELQKGVHKFFKDLSGDERAFEGFTNIYENALIVSGGISLLIGAAKGSIALSKSKKVREFIDILKGTKVCSKATDKIDDFEKWLKDTVKPNKSGSANKGIGNTSEGGFYSTKEWYNHLKDKYGENNVYLCTDEKSLINSVSEKLENYITKIDGNIYGKTAVAYGENLDTVSIATSNSHQYNPTILTDGEKFNKNMYNKILEECGDESVAYSKYYENTLTEGYIKNSLTDEYFTSKGLIKDDVISEMKKLTDAIENTKEQAKIEKSFSKLTGNPSFEKWNVENCAEVWSTRKAILNGAKFNDISFKCLGTASGNYAKPCENCKRTFRNLNNVGKVK